MKNSEHYSMLSSQHSQFMAVWVLMALLSTEQVGVLISCVFMAVTNLAAMLCALRVKKLYEEIE